MIFKLAALGAFGYVGYRYYEKNQRKDAVVSGPNGSSQFEPTRGSSTVTPRTKVDTWDSPEANDISPTRTSDTTTI